MIEQSDELMELHARRRVIRNTFVDQMQAQPFILGDNFAFEWWLERRRATEHEWRQTEAAKLARQCLMDMPKFGQWSYGWFGRSRTDTPRLMCMDHATPENAAEGRFLLDCGKRGPLFPPTLLERCVEAERAMAPVCYAVIACGLAFIGFAAWWMR